MCTRAAFVLLMCREQYGRARKRSLAAPDWTNATCALSAQGFQMLACFGNVLLCSLIHFSDSEKKKGLQLLNLS